MDGRSIARETRESRAAPPLALLVESLRAWRIPGTVRVEPDGIVLVEAAGQRLRVEPSPLGLPFRWMLVGEQGRRRGATSLSSLLRLLHVALDPEYEATRLRIAEPLPPPGHAP